MKTHGIHHASAGMVRHGSSPRTEAQATLWTPDQLTLSAWFDATDASTITTVGNNVSQWNDKSGNGNHAAQFTASRQPTYSPQDADFNNLSVIGNSSDGGNLGLVTPNLNFSDVIAVARYKDGTAISFSNYASLISGDISSFGERRIMGRIGDSKLMTTSSVADGVVSKNGNNPSATVLPMPPSIITAQHPSTISQSVNILFNPAQGRTWNGDIAELILMDGMTDNEKYKIEGYLAHKYGITSNLPTDHLYKTSAPTV